MDKVDDNFKKKLSRLVKLNEEIKLMKQETAEIKEHLIKNYYEKSKELKTAEVSCGNNNVIKFCEKDQAGSISKKIVWKVLSNLLEDADAKKIMGEIMSSRKMKHHKSLQITKKSQ